MADNWQLLLLGSSSAGDSFETDRDDCVTSDDGDEGKAQADWLWRVSCQSTGVVNTVLHHCPTQVLIFLFFHA